MKVCLPYRGEFGFTCMWHAPQVRACAEKKMVCCEPGMEAMYPGAERYIHVERRKDVERRARPERELLRNWRGRLAAELGESCEFVEPDAQAPREYFVPEPVERYGADCEVVVCPRRREYGPDKNWPHWQELIDRLSDRWAVFAGGAADSSFDVSRCGRAWDFARCLDATIEAMLSARLVVATDNGLAHLAVLCGRPVAMIAYGAGLVAPGRDDVGTPYWPIRLDRYELENHKGAEISVIEHGWEDLGKVEVVVSAIAEALSEEIER